MTASYLGWVVFTSLFPLCYGQQQQHLQLFNSFGLSWTFPGTGQNFAIGTPSLFGESLGGAITSGWIGLYSRASKQTDWLFPDSISPSVDNLSLVAQGEYKLQNGLVNTVFYWELNINLLNTSKGNSGISLSLTYHSSMELRGFEVLLSFVDTTREAGDIFAQQYPFAGKSNNVSVGTISYVGWPLTLLYHTDMSSAALFGLDTETDYLNPTTYTGNVSFSLNDWNLDIINPTYRFSNGYMEANVEQIRKLQLFLVNQQSTRVFSPSSSFASGHNSNTGNTGTPGDSIDFITHLTDQLFEYNKFSIEELYVRDPSAGLRCFAEGRRHTAMWQPGKGYQLQASADAQFIYLGTNPESAYFEYLLYLQTNDTLWRDRAFAQMNFTLEGIYRNDSSRHNNAFYTAFDLPSQSFNTEDRDHPGWKPDINGHIIRYTLLLWDLVRAHEGIDHQEWYLAAQNTAHWLLDQANNDGGFPQCIDLATDEPSLSVVSGRILNAFPVMMKYFTDTVEYNYTASLARFEAFIIESVEGQYWFTGQHPDLYPLDYEQDSVWEVIEYWLHKYERSERLDRESLRRAIGSTRFATLMLCPKQLSWVGNPTQLAACEQQRFHQYSVYTYHNRKYLVLHQLGEILGDPLYSAMAQRVLQNNMFTQAITGNVNSIGGYYEAISDPWLERGGGFNYMGTVYMSELSLDLSLQLLLMGVEPSNSESCSSGTSFTKELKTEVA